MTVALNPLLSRAVSTYPKGVRGAFSGDQVVACRGIVDRIIQAAQEDAPDANWCPMSKFLIPGWPPIADELLKLFIQTRAFEIAREILGDQIVVLMQHTIARRRDVSVATDRSPWHLDVDFMGTAGEMVNMWVPLVEVGAGHPGLTFLIDEAATKKAWEHWREWATENWSATNRHSSSSLFGNDEHLSRVLGVELSDVAKTPILQAGDALLFNQAVLHRTQDATGATGPRYSVEFRLARRDDMPETYRVASLPTALISVAGSQASIRYLPSDRLSD